MPALVFRTVAMLVAGLLAFAMPAQAGESAADPTQSPQAAEMMPRASLSTLLDITFTGQHFIAVGDHGDIVQSADGKTWHQVASPVRAMLNRVHFIDSKNGWIVGHDASILHTADGGQNWTLQHFDPSSGQPFYDVVFIDPSHGFAVGGNGLFMHSEDGGASWQAVNTPLAELALNFYSICKLNNGTLFITGEKGLLARSTDMGASWQLLKSPYAGSSFGALPVGDTGALIYGLRGNVYRAGNIKSLTPQDPKTWDEFSNKTITDPATLQKMGWQRLDNPIQQSVFGATMVDAQRILMVGVNGAVLVGNLQTNQLQALPFRSDAPLSAAAVHGRLAIVVGRNGVQQLEGIQ